ncbi:HalOD1 output domain-containing protein [Haloferax larsenii]|nr:HalOD1 output domain-containing protein [Haloferax larsenii]
MNSLTEALVTVATELGVDPTQEPTRLQDVLDVDSLHALVGDAKETTVQVSFDIWGIQFTVTHLTVAATSDT